MDIKSLLDPETYASLMMSIPLSAEGMLGYWGNLTRRTRTFCRGSIVRYRKVGPTIMK